MTQQSAVSLRRVNEVQEWIDAENFPKALQVCEKWFKKGERSSAFITKRALSLALQKDPGPRQRARDEILKLCERVPALTAVGELLDLERSMKSLDIGHEIAQRAWDRAAKADPKNSELQETRLRHCIDRRDIKGAQQAATTLRNNFPAARRYEFWAIFLSYVLALEYGVSDPMFGQLAYRRIKALADQTPKNIQEDELQSAKCILYPEELLLLLDIYRRLGKHEEIMEVLESDNLGCQSRIGKQDPTLFSAYYRRTVWNLRQERKFVDLCLDKFKQILANEDKDQPATQNTEALSTVIPLVECVWKLCDNDVDNMLQNFSAEALEKEPKNIAFRYLQLYLTTIDVRKGAQSPDTMLALCKSFFEDFSSFWSMKATIQHLIDSLGRDSARELADFAWQVVSRVQEHHPDFRDFKMVQNALEIEYCFSISQSSKREIHATFVCKCLKVYEEAYQKPDLDETLRSSATIPAVMSLLRMSELSVTNLPPLQMYGPSTFQACLLLYHAVEKLPQGADPCVLLISYALMLGLIPIALHAFQKLSIKNLQVDNFAHNMFTRISTLHPHDISGHSGEKKFRLSDYLRTAIAQYEADDRTFAKQIMSGLYQGAYANVNEAISERAAKARSLCKQVYILEYCRIGRLLGENPEQSFDLSWAVIDTRTSEGIPNLELPGHAPFAEHLRFAPYPRENWASAITQQMVALNFLAILGTASAQNQDLKARRLQEEISELDNLLDSLEDCRDQFTEVELPLLQFIYTYVKAAAFLHWSNSIDRSEAPFGMSEFMNMMDMIEKWLETKLLDLSDQRRLGPLATVSEIHGRQLPATWLYFHWSYATLEALQGLAMFLNMSKLYPAPKVEGGFFVEARRWEYMRGTTGEVVKKIHDHAKHLRGELDKPGFLDDMTDMILERSEARTGLIGQRLEKLVDESTMEELLGMMKDSWASGLEGIMKVKVALP